MQPEGRQIEYVPRLEPKGQHAAPPVRLAIPAVGGRLHARRRGQPVKAARPTVAHEVGERMDARIEARRAWLRMAAAAKLLGAGQLRIDVVLRVVVQRRRGPLGAEPNEKVAPAVSGEEALLDRGRGSRRARRSRVAGPAPTHGHRPRAGYPSSSALHRSQRTSVPRSARWASSHYQLVAQAYWSKAVGDLIISGHAKVHIPELVSACRRICANAHRAKLRHEQ